MPGPPAEITLVTGGNGAIGAPLIESLASGQASVVSLARGAQPVARPGVRLLTGDIRQGATLGLDDSTAAELRSRVTTIVHAAALTRFDAPLDAARQTNVDGTAHLLAFAAQCPRLERLCALSTVYVAGRRTGTILEPELEHDRGFVNHYEQSKYESEELLRGEMARLPIAICRLSTTLGDSASGRVDRPAAIHQAMRFLHHSLLPMIPGTPESPVDVIPTDYAVAAVRHLAGAGFVAGSTFHVCAGTDAPREEELIDVTDRHIPRPPPRLAPARHRKTSHRRTRHLRALPPLGRRSGRFGAGGVGRRPRPFRAATRLPEDIRRRHLSRCAGRGGDPPSPGPRYIGQGGEVPSRS